MIMNGLPHGPSFGKWLYPNDEIGLQGMLEKAGRETLVGLAWNCRFLGVINPKVIKPKQMAT